MSVFNGQVGNAASWNLGFLSRLTDSDTIAIVGLANANPLSGAAITNIQREFSAHASFLGMATNSLATVLPIWTNLDVGGGSDNIKTRVEALTAEFNVASGHNHDGTAGNGGLISSLNLANFNKFFAEFQTDVFASAVGLDDDVTSVFSTLTPGGGVAAIGVPTTAPYNRVELRTDPNGDQIEEPGGKLVYGRLTESSGTWTLTYFYEDTGGVETAYSLPSQNIRLYWREVFDASTRPTFGTDTGFIGSYDATADVIDASATQRGVVSIGAQSFSGQKTFLNGAIMSEALSLERLNVSSGGVVTALANTHSFIKITGGSTTELQGISQPSSAMFLILYNASSGALTIKHQNTGAPGNHRIITSDGNDLVLNESESAQLIYDTNGSRWRVFGGVGAGGGGVAYQELLGTGDDVTTSFGPMTQVASSEDSIAVYLNGVMTDSSEWAQSGNDIVFTVAPATGTSVYVYYLTNGSPSPSGPTGTQNVEYRTLTAPEAAAESLTLSATPASASLVMVDVIGGTAQEYAVDYTVSGTTLSWAGLGLAGLALGDKLRINYLS
jgi:hypothetical protein